MWNLIRFSGFYSSILRSSEEDGRSEASGPSCHSGPEAVPDDVRILTGKAGALRQLDLVVAFILVPRQSLMMPGYLAGKAGVLRQLVVAFILVPRQSLMMPGYL